LQRRIAFGLKQAAPVPGPHLFTPWQSYEGQVYLDGFDAALAETESWFECLDRPEPARTLPTLREELMRTPGSSAPSFRTADDRLVEFAATRNVGEE
jgi:hypothetical protein